jgi:hypothetical protein
MSSRTAPVERDDPTSEWEVLRPSTGGGDREGLSLEGDRRVSDRAALALLAAARADVVTRRDPPEPPFEAGVSDAFPSGWPLRHAGEARWELDGSYYLG